MQILAKSANLEKYPCDLLVVNLFEGVGMPGSGTGAVDKALKGLISQIIKEEEFEGKEGKSILIHSHGKIPAKKVLLLGLGKQEDFDLDAIRKVAAISVRKAKEIKAKKVATILHGAGIGQIPVVQAAQSLAGGAFLGNYKFLKYKTDDKQKSQNNQIEELAIVEKDASKIQEIEKGIKAAEIMCKGVLLARDLVNEPPVNLKPSTLVAKAREIARQNKDIKVEVLGKRELEKLGAGVFLGVAMGSDEPSYIARLIYKPGNPSKDAKRIAIIGKAITFDSGGLSLKQAESMETMKIDMAGAAAVLGVFSVISKIKPKYEVHGIFATCENLPSGKAIKPGDILKSISGKTIEVLNTDAEGRLTLAEAVSYALKFKPDYLIDLATLTGACMIALGEEYAGLFSNNKELSLKIQEAAKLEGEKVWPLPLAKEYKELLKSEVADIKNIADTRYGGAITGALMIEEFVGDTPWAHLDIAGPAWQERDNNPYIPKGGTGFGVRTLLRFLLNLT